MATMPFSGTISSANLQSVFGLYSSYSSSGYYRGGRIPSNELVIGTWSEFTYSPGSTEWVTNSSNNTFQVYWNGGTMGSGSGTSSTERIFGSFQYERGILSSSAGNFAFYSVRRRYYVYEAINTDVPFSGQISSSQWYGARTAN